MSKTYWHALALDKAFDEEKQQKTKTLEIKPKNAI
jgi:hypothetical protein